MWGRFVKQTNALLKRRFSTLKYTLLGQCLEERTLLRMTGKDTRNYLQGLITNDIRHLQEGGLSMFTMFLNSKGRVLYDSIIYNIKNENTFLIECDVQAADSLKKHLLHFQVRKKINIDLLNDEIKIWAVINKDNFDNIKSNFHYDLIINFLKKNLPQLTITSDPRLSNMGLRILTPKTFNLNNEINKIENISLQDKCFYKLMRYKLGIGEGINELVPEKCFPMEINGDYLHGISFHKGCYIGQELTARTFHTGAIRKRLMPLIFNETIEISETGIPILSALQPDKSIGKVIGIKKLNGVGLLRIEEALKTDKLIVCGNKCTTHRPFWWPIEAPKTRMKIG